LLIYPRYTSFWQEAFIAPRHPINVWW